MIRASLFAFLLAVTALSLLQACDNKGNEKMTTPVSSAVEISINAEGEALMQKYPASISVTRQPAGLSFYKASWPSHHRGSVRLQHGAHSFEIHNVITLLGTQDDEEKSRGISDITVVSGMSGPSGIDHSAARDHFFAIINELSRAGWKSIIPFSAPRLAGRDLFIYLFTSGEYTTLDASYSPTLDEWMKLANLTSWDFYADGVFLSLNFVRDKRRMDIHKPGSYIVNYEVKSDVEYFKGFVDPGRRDEWRTLLPAALEENAVRRRLAEEQMSNRGVLIHSEYKDPPVPRK